MATKRKHISIFTDTTESDTTDTATVSLELEHFKNKIKDIWARILENTYSDNDDITKEQYLEENALHFSDKEKPEDDIDDLLEMLDGLEEESLTGIKDKVRELRDRKIAGIHSFRRRI